MMQLTLAMPSLFWPHAETSLPAFDTPGLNGLRRWGRWRAEAMSTSAFYSRYLWTQPPQDSASAQLGLAATSTCFLCSPISQNMGMHQASFIDGSDLALDAAAAGAFCAVLSEFFHDDGWRFLPWQPTRWIVQMSQPLTWSAPALLDLAGVIDGASKPSGADATVLLQRQTEIQMLLYQHPLNQARQQQGLPPINGVWVERPLAGTAATPPLLCGANTWAWPPAADRLVTTIDEVLPAAGAEQVADIVLFFSALQTPVHQGDAFAYQRLLHQWDQQWFTPLCQALRQRRLTQLMIATDGAHGGCLTVRRPLLPPFWRRPARFNGVAL